jgi:hypothetical protein
VQEATKSEEEVLFESVETAEGNAEPKIKVEQDDEQSS